MKKIIIITISLAFILLEITGCFDAQNAFIVGSESDIEVFQRDVKLSIKQETLTPTGTTLILENNDDKSLYYNEEYKLEIRKDDKWHNINTEIEFNELIQNLENRQSKEIKLDWQNIYGKLSKGEYRILKKVYFEEQEEDKFYIAAEFVIN